MRDIIIVTKNMTDGGAERVLSELMVEWIKCGYNISIVQLRPDEFSDSYKISEDIELINIKAAAHNKQINRIAQARQLIKVLNSRTGTTVLAFVKQAVLEVGMASFFIKNKIVFSERNDPKRSPPSRLGRFIRNIMFRFADICVFQTKEAQEYFCKSVQKKGIIIPNPINAELLEPYKGKRRKAIVAVCRLDQQKNIPMTIYAFKKLLEDYPEYTLEIYGRGELEKELQELIDQLGLQEKVFLMGFSHQVYEKLRDASVYVSSSNYEGISNSMLEALGMGVPTVCTDCPCGGARTYIKNNESGLLVPVGDVDAFYLAMKKILDDPNFANKLSINACKIREELPVKKIAEQWMDVLM